SRSEDWTRRLLTLSESDRSDNGDGSVTMARRLLPAHEVSSSAARESISAGLEQIQRRQELLARGDALPRLRTPLLATRESDLSPASAPATTATTHSHVQGLQRGGGRAAPRDDAGRENTTSNTVAHTQCIRWVRRHVQKLHLQRNTTDEIGTIEFATIASLAGVRQLINQFYPLPSKREYEFYHPILRVRIDPSDEENVLPSDFPTIVIVVLPLPPRARPAPIPTSEVVRATVDQSAVIPSRVATPSDRHTKHLRTVQAVPVGATETRTAAPAAQPAAYRDLVFAGRMVSDTRCDVTLRVFHSKDVIGVRARVKEGAFVGRSTITKWMNESDIASLLEQTAALPTSNEELSTAKYSELVGLLALRFPDQLSGDIEVILSSMTRVTNATAKDQTNRAVSPSLSTGVPAALGDSPPESNSPKADLSPRVADVFPDTKTEEELFEGEHHNEPESGGVQAPVVAAVTYNGVDTPAAEFMDTATLECHDGDDSRPIGAAVEEPLELFLLSAEDSEVADPVFVSDPPELKTPDNGTAESTKEQPATSRFGPAEQEQEDDSVQGARHDSPLVIQTELAADHHDFDAEMDGFDLSDFEYVPFGQEDDPTALLLFDHGGTVTGDEAVPVVPNKTARRDEAEGDRAGELEPEDGVDPECEVRDPRLPDPMLSPVTSRHEDEEYDVPSDPSVDRPSVVSVESPTVQASGFDQLRGDNGCDNVRTQNFVNAFLGKLLSNFETAEQGTSSLFTADQLCRSMLQYGVDHREFGLSGVFLAAEDALCILSEPFQPSVDKLLKGYILSMFPSGSTADRRVSDDTHSDDLSWLRRIENALNVLSDMRSWHEPTRIRMFCIEKHSSNSFLPFVGAESKSAAFRLSDSDRELLSGAHANESFGTGIDRWVADGLELFYLFLYSFLNSQRNTGPGAITKMNFCRTRVERVQAAVQKAISLDAAAWRRLEFVYSEIEDYPTLARIRELMNGLLNTHKPHAKALEACVFFPILLAFVERKAEQISQSLVEFVLHERRCLPLATAETSYVPPTASEVTLFEVHQCVAAFRAALASAQFDASTPLEGYLRNVGLKTVDMDAVNKTRSARSLPRIGFSGKHSLATHHQSELLGSDYALHLRPRWNQPRLKSGQLNRYVFHADATVALEAVYVRRNVELDELQGKPWVDVQRYVEGDIREAYKLLSAGTRPKTANVLLAVGVNALHVGILMIENLSLHAVVARYPGAQALSLGYCVSQDAEIAAVRVVFRVHVSIDGALDGGPLAAKIPSPSDAVVSMTDSLQRCIALGNDTVLARALESNCLSFLLDCLDGSRQQQWLDVACGGEFYSTIEAANAGVHYCTDDVLQCLSQLIERLPLALSTVTKRNLQVVTTLGVKIQGTSSIETSLLSTVLQTLRLLCSPLNANAPPSAPTRVMPFTDLQRRFADEDGLKLLVNASELLAVSLPSRQPALEEMVLRLLKATELSATKSALLVHWRHWMTYFVENGAYAATRANSEFVPVLLQSIHDRLLRFLLEPGTDRHVQSAILRTLSLSLDLCIEKAVWKVSMSAFLAPLYEVLQALCSSPARESEMNAHMLATLFQRDRTLSWAAIDRSDSEVADVRVQLHEEHKRALQARDEIAAARRRSLLESLYWLLTLPPDFPLQPMSHCPALICFGWLMNSAPVAHDCAELGLIPVLLNLLECDSAASYILSARLLTVLLFQLLSAELTLDTNELLRLGNALTMALSAGARISIGQYHGDASEFGSLRFSADYQDSLQLLERYADMNTSLKTTDGGRGADSPASLLDRVWDAHEWQEHDRSTGFKTAAMLNLLVVLSSLTGGVQELKSSAELTQIQFSLWRFVRDREFVADTHLALYLLALRNILFTLGSNVLSVAVPAYTDLVFVQKLLAYSRRKASGLIPELASSVLWTLARAYESTNTFAAAFVARIDDPDEVRSSAPVPAGTVATTPTTSGIVMLSESILVKFTSGSAIDCDIAALTSLLRCRLCDDIFLARYGYHFVIKILDGIHQSAAASATTKGVFATRIVDRKRPLFGPLLFYNIELPRHEKELLQLCRLAHSCLVALHRSTPSAKQALVLVVDFVFRLSSEHLVQEVAAVFAESPENRALLAGLFTTLSTQSAENPESGYALQLLVRLVVRLDLVALTDPNLLVGAICATLTQQNDSTFLRPLLCNCLFRVAAEAKHDEAFARTSRLDTITDLLKERLTLGELLSVGGLLSTVAARHEGIRQYLQRSVSGCIGKVCRVLGTFFQVTVDGVADAWESPNASADILSDIPDADESAAGQDSRFVVKMTTGRRVFISHYTDAIYEQAECGRTIARFLASRRVLLRCGYDLSYFLGSSGIGAESLVALSLRLFAGVSLSHLARAEASETTLDRKRASLFTIARLAECREVVADPLFQEKAAALLAQPERMLGDPVSLANLMVLTRNVVELTPTMRGRIAGPTTLSALVSLLLSADHDLARLGADVLAHALYFERSKERHATRAAATVAVVEATPGPLLSSAVGSDLIGVAGLFFESDIAAGVAYELLYTLCYQYPSSVEKVLEQFTRADEGQPPQVATGFVNFVRGIRLEYLSVRVSASKIKGQETERAVTLLDPRAPSAPAIAYAVGLLNILSVRSPAVVPWLIECQGIQALFDLLQLDATFTSKLPTNIRATFTSSVVELLGRAVAGNPVAAQAVAADARVLIRIVSFVYALESRTQLAVLGLLRVLAASAPIRAMLVQLELTTSSARTVDSSMLEFLQGRLSELRVSRPLRPREVLELSHILQIPLFADLTTAELLRLSLGFVESRLVEDAAFMILAADGHFSAVPHWMLSTSSDSDVQFLHPTNQNYCSQMEHVGSAFQEACAASAASGSLMVYKIQQEGYYRCTTPVVRKHVAKRALKLLRHDINSSVRPHVQAHATSGLIARLCRFLVEDRAELVRRAAFASKRDEHEVFSGASAKKLSNVMSLLSRVPLFSSVSRDALACLAYSLDAPRVVALGGSGVCDPDSLWLILSEDWRVTITSDSHERDGDSERAVIGRRGSLICCPEWLIGACASRCRLRFTADAHATAVAYAVEVSRRNLLAALGESATHEITNRFQQAAEDGDGEALAAMTAAPLGEAPHPSRSGYDLRPQQQVAALQLLKLLIADRDMALALVSNVWAARIVIEVAVSALSGAIVSLALDIVDSLVNDEVVCCKFRELKTEEITTEAPRHCHEESAVVENIPAVVSLVRQFAVLQWATNAAILKQFFGLQHCVFETVPSAAENIAQIWTPAYFDSCLFVLQLDRLSRFRTAEVTAAHFVRAIPRHGQLVKQRGRASSLHLETMHVLIRAPEPIRCSNLMALACFLWKGSGEVWTQVEVSADSFDQLMSSAPEATSALSGDEDPRVLIPRYCEFVELICSNEVDKVRDRAIRERLESRFSVLSALLLLLSKYDNYHYVRCIRSTW
ncbi:hypothetical protein PybrP1_003242, partial [[Pythium] brassicae (nom. inval.)]